MSIRGSPAADLCLSARRRCVPRRHGGGRASATLRLRRLRRLRLAGRRCSFARSATAPRFVPKRRDAHFARLRVKREWHCLTFTVRPFRKNRISRLPISIRDFRFPDSRFPILGQRERVKQCHSLASRGSLSLKEMTAPP